MSRVRFLSAAEETKWLVAEVDGQWAVFERYYSYGILFGTKKIADLDQAVAERWQEIIRHRNRAFRITFLAVCSLVLFTGTILPYFVQESLLGKIAGIEVICLAIAFLLAFYWSIKDFDRSIPIVQTLLQEIGLGHIPAKAIRGPGDNRVRL